MSSEVELRTRKVLEQVEATPGANLRQIHLRSGVPVAAVGRILRELERKGVVKREMSKKDRRFFPKGVGRSREERALLTFLNRPRARRILEYIHANPGVRQKRLAGELGLDPPAAAYWVNRFEEEGLLIVDRRGASCKYELKKPQQVRQAFKQVKKQHVFAS